MAKFYIILFILMPGLVPIVNNCLNPIEQEIFASLIAEEFSDPEYEPEEGNPIIIIAETSTQTINKQLQSVEKFQQNGLPSLDSLTLNDFIQKNESIEIINEFSIPNIDIRFMTKKDWDEVMNRGGWSLYHKTYGYIPTIVLSRPGINEDGNIAFIYYSAISDKLGGAGFYLILEKMNDSWTVKDKIIAWRS